MITASIPVAMPRDEVDPSVITNEPRKRTLSSYVHDPDNISGDRDQYVKRIKQTVNPGVFLNRRYFVLHFSYLELSLLSMHELFLLSLIWLSFIA